MGNVNQSFGTVNERTMKRWFKKFWDEDEEGRGPLFTDDNEKRLVNSNPRTMVREFADELSFSHTTILAHLKKLKIKKLDKCVPHGMIENQRNPRFEVSSLLLLCNKKNFLMALWGAMKSGLSTITGDTQSVVRT